MQPNVSVADVAAAYPDLTNIEHLDEGGQKIVLKAVWNGNELVIKYVSICKQNQMQSIDSNTNLQRIQREIEVLEAVQSDFLTTIMPLGSQILTVGGWVFFVYTEKLLSPLAGNMPIDSIVALAHDIASGVKILWDNGQIIHRDIKPGNIMFDQTSNTYRLIDLGFALMRSKSTLTPAGHSPGTLPYMSPEQLSGLRNQLDFRSDQFSLGVTLFELITGINPFRAAGDDESAIAQKIIRLREPSLVSLRSDCPAGLETLVHKLLGKHPHMRFNTMDKVIAATGNLM